MVSGICLFIARYLQYAMITSLWDKCTSKILTPSASSPEWLKNACNVTCPLVNKYHPFVYDMTTFISMFLDPRFAWMNMVAAMRTESYFATFKAMYHLKREEHLNAGSNVQNNSIDDDGAVDNDVIVEDEGNVDAVFDDDDSDEEMFLESLQSHEVMEEEDELERYKSLYPIEINRNVN
ncbi:hypothetical protein GEMRC1_009654 [Eukaryota sp. GEM-RC1]